MRQTIRLSLAIIFACVAAGINWLWMVQSHNFPKYVFLDSAVECGEEISKENLVAVAVPGDFETMSKSLVPWNQKELWYDRTATRSYRANEPLLQRDMSDTPTRIQWDSLGPFTLVGVGDKPASVFDGEPGQLITVSGNTLILASDDDEQENGLLYRYLAGMRGEYFFHESAQDRELLRIIGVEPRISTKKQNRRQQLTNPTGSESSTAIQQEAFAGKRLMFVSLNDIPNAPSWLRIGEEIFFIVPPGKSRFKGLNPSN